MKTPDWHSLQKNIPTLVPRPVLTILSIFLAVLLITSSLWLLPSWIRSFDQQLSLSPSPIAQSSENSPVSPLLFGSNLILSPNRNTLMTSSATPGLLRELHVRVMRILISTDTPLESVYQAAQTMKALSIQPLVVLQGSIHPQALEQNELIIKVMNEIFDSDLVYYELGNEEDSLGVTAERYAAFWNELVPHLKQLAGKAHFVGPVTSQYNQAYLRTFLERARPQPDAISWHEYTCDRTWSKEQCLSGLALWQQHISDARATLQNTIGEMLPLIVSEWNYAANASFDDGKSADSAFLSTWTAQALQQLASNGVFASMHYATNWVASPLISKAYRLTPQGVAFQQQYKQYIKPAPSPTPASSPSSTPLVAHTLVDELDDWSKIYSATDNLTLDSENSESFHDDPSRACRQPQILGHEEIIWSQPNITRFQAFTYYWLDEPVSHFSFYTSYDGETWQLVHPQINPGIGIWAPYTYILDKLPKVTFVKMRWNNTNGESWNPQISKVVITYLSPP